jgi:hypothetical protein
MPDMHLTLADIEPAIRFSPDERGQTPVVVARPAGPPRRCVERYAALSARVLATLGRAAPVDSE